MFAKFKSRRGAQDLPAEMLMLMFAGFYLTGLAWLIMHALPFAHAVMVGTGWVSLGLLVGGFLMIVPITVQSRLHRRKQDKQVAAMQEFRAQSFSVELDSESFVEWCRTGVKQS